MLADVPSLPAETLEVVRHHHERWDGTGYPDGLASDAIPLGARIFTIVDVWDALTSVRPYKEAWSRAAARDEIQRAAARQFDPVLTRLFLDLESSLPAEERRPRDGRHPQGDLA
ncbi:MAG: HD domain-containing phosphohydrolase [Trueperaceae bacterium]|nr:HD domain-containing phosphohydrolase [Trueperaceae bacterium]